MQSGWGETAILNWISTTLEMHHVQKLNKCFISKHQLHWDWQAACHKNVLLKSAKMWCVKSHALVTLGNADPIWPMSITFVAFTPSYFLKKLLKPSISTTFPIFNWETHKMILYQIETRRKEGDLYNMGRVMGCHRRNTFQCMPFEQVAKKMTKAFPTPVHME